ncbi:BON domain-containing protein [Candidatus Bathyarchaeota archaeon]|nr:BON domain-containing protein [Candidatus Bathyarchaeota archaeon]
MLQKHEIIKELTWNGKVDASTITVEVDDGVVTLAGTVGSFLERVEAEMVIRNMKGVKDVQNEIKINPLELTRYPSDEEMQERIMKILSWDGGINEMKLDTSVENGIVLLEGTVDAFWKRSYVEYKISGILGVRGIVNKIAIAPKEQRSDENIAKRIMDAIYKKKLASPGDIDLKVKDGVLEFRGEVEDWNTWWRIYNLASSMQGVVEIIDSIRVSI